MTLKPVLASHFAADIGAMESDEPIFELAGDCEVLFAKQLTKLYDCDEQDGVKLILELSQRFMAWAELLGVFAESQVCLDRKLRHHAEIEDQFLRLLSIVQRNLTYRMESIFQT